MTEKEAKKLADKYEKNPPDIAREYSDYENLQMDLKTLNWRFEKLEKELNEIKKTGLKKESQKSSKLEYKAA
jgi:hypothetical protein